MPVSYIARPPGWPTSNPPVQIAGRFILPTIQQIGELDIWASVNADINPIVSPFAFQYFYSVEWAIRSRLNAPLPTNLSAYFGNPERRYIGQMTFGTLSSNRENVIIQFESQDFQSYRFLYTNTRSRIVAVTDIAAVPATALNYIVTPSFSPAIPGVPASRESSLGYADFARWAYFDGVDAEINCIYTVNLLNLDDNATSSIGLPS